MILKNMFSIPWIADFRDPWSDNFHLREQMLPWQKTVEGLLETKIIRTADRIIANTNLNRMRLIKRYPHIDEKKVVAIHNGFEPSLPNNNPLVFNKFTIVHTGIFYPQVKPYFFFHALHKWLKMSDYRARRRTRVLLIGEESAETKDIIAHLGLGDVVKFVRRVTHRKAMTIARASDILLVSLGFDTQNAGWVPMKIYDYLVCGRPILAFLPPGEASQIIQDTKTGYVVHSEDVNGTVEILQRAYEHKFTTSIHNFGFQPNSEKINLYNASYLTGKLASLMNELTK
jgi:glycosyltransferase involved in cell wall biosynthesis